MSSAPFAEAPSAAGRRRRVLHLITRLDRGGSTDNTVLSCLGLDDRGWEVTLAHGRTACPASSLDDLDRRPGIRRVSIPELVRPVRPLQDLRAYVAVRRLLVRGDHDLVHTHSSKAGLVGRAAALGRRCRVVHTPHGHVFEGYFGALASRAIARVESRAARWCDRIVVLTDRGREDHLRWGVGRPEQFVTIPSGVPLDRFAKLPPRAGARAALGLPDDAWVVGCVARLVAIKGQGHLLEATARLAPRHPGLRLLIVGDGERRDALEARARSAGLGERVRFTGDLPDTRPALAALDLFVMPSLNEGQGRAVIEAMAAGLPVVASAVGGLPDVLSGGECGVLVPPGSARALETALESLRLAPQRAAELAAAGRRRARSFDTETMVGRLDALYRSLLVGVAHRAPAGHARPAAIAPAIERRRA